MVESQAPRDPAARDATHDVEARRQGGRAVLRCRACGVEGEVLEGEFHRLNDFVDQHRGCVGLARTPSAP